MTITLNFYTHLKLLLGLMIGMTAFRVANCKPFKKDGDQFSFKIFLEGCLRQLIVMIGCMAVFMCGVDCGDELLLVQMGGSKLTIHGAIDVAILIVDAHYAAKFIKNLLIFFGIKDVEVEPIVNSNCSCSCGSCNHGKLIGYCYAAKDDCSCGDSIEVCPLSVSDLIEECGYDSVDGGSSSDDDCSCSSEEEKG